MAKPVTSEPEGDGEEAESEGWKMIHQSASSSITRGDQSIVGNTIPVLEARELLARGGEDVKGMKDWMKRHHPDSDQEDDGENEEIDVDVDVDDWTRWICPGCKGVI
jgi:hypothetical protein